MANIRNRKKKLTTWPNTFLQFQIITKYDNLKGSNPVPYRNPTCKNALKFKVCANVLDLVKVSLPQRSKCCGLIKGLVDLEAAVCLCTALKADLLGLKLNVPISLSVILNQCGKKVPSGFKCA
ncbi:hypothetical protein YC2023_084884 [Brassica napus]